MASDVSRLSAAGQAGSAGEGFRWMGLLWEADEPSPAPSSRAVSRGSQSPVSPAAGSWEGG